jgi:RimJ/RimL family protein N-acetyltransferase
VLRQSAWLHTGFTALLGGVCFLASGNSGFPLAAIALRGPAGQTPAGRRAIVVVTAPGSGGGGGGQLEEIIMNPMFVTSFTETDPGDLLAGERDKRRRACKAGRARAAPVIRVAAEDASCGEREGGMSVHGRECAYALLANGVTVRIRTARPGDLATVRDMYAKMSPEHRYLRFFSMSPFAAEQEARRVCREPAPDHAALLAVLDGQVVGCATYERAGAGCRSAEVAFAVADGMYRRGIGTLLLRHLVLLARSRGVRTFTAQTLRSNTAMQRVFAGSGLAVQRSLADGIYDFTLLLPASGADAA